MELGGVEGVKEECRDERGVSVVENIAADVAYAWRGLKRSPGFVLTAAVAIALGIGANTALFSIVYALVFRPLPVLHPETLRNVHVQTFGEGNRSSYGTMYNVSWAEFNFIRSNAKTADVAGIAAVTMSRKGDSRPVRAHLVTGICCRCWARRRCSAASFAPRRQVPPAPPPLSCSPTAPGANGTAERSMWSDRRLN